MHFECLKALTLFIPLYFLKGETLVLCLEQEKEFSSSFSFLALPLHKICVCFGEVDFDLYQAFMILLQQRASDHRIADKQTCGDSHPFMERETGCQQKYVIVDWLTRIAFIDCMFLKKWSKFPVS